MYTKAGTDPRQARAAAGGHTRLLLLGCAALLGTTTPGGNPSAHHGTFTFDADSVVTIEGVVTEHDWTNPHSFIYVETTGSDGAPREIVIEADGASILRPLGVSADSIRAGEHIVATASPSRREGSNAVLGRELIKADGDVVRLSARFAREMDARSEAPATSVLGTWVPELGALFDFVADRAEWQLTEAGQASLAAYDTSDPFAHSECVAVPAPTLMVYPTTNTLRRSGDRIVIDADWMGAERIVHLDAEAPPANVEPSRHGYSTGRFEGSTLVVETRAFAQNPIGNTFGVASGAGKRLVERFSLVEDGYALEYSFRLEDPEYLAEPVRGRHRWLYRPDVEASGVACDVEAASHYLED